MPDFEVLQRRSTNQVAMVHVRGGESRPLPRIPSGFSMNGGYRIGTLERQGHKPLTRPDGPELMTIDFTIKVGWADPTDYLAKSYTSWFRVQYKSGKQIKFSGLPSHFAGWWYITSMPVQVDRISTSSNVILSEISFTLQEVEDFTGKVTRYPKPKTPAGSRARTPTQRTHVVQSGDWLSKIAQRYLGDMNRWPEIYRLNKAEIDRRGNPDLIFPGQRFKIPPK